MIECLTVLFLSLAAWFDFRTMRIPNRLQWIALAGVWLAIFLFDPQSWKYRLALTGILFLIFFLLVALKQCGFGDLKMMTWVGAGLGLDVFGAIFASGLGASCYWIWKKLNRDKTSWTPFAPSLLGGWALWGIFIHLVGPHFSLT